MKMDFKFCLAPPHNIIFSSWFFSFAWLLAFLFGMTTEVFLTLPLWSCSFVTMLF